MVTRSQLWPCDLLSVTTIFVYAQTIDNQHIIPKFFLISSFCGHMVTAVTMWPRNRFLLNSVSGKLILSRANTNARKYKYQGLQGEKALSSIVSLYPNSRLPIPKRLRAHTQFERYIFPVHKIIITHALKNCPKIQFLRELNLELATFKSNKCWN